MLSSTDTSTLGKRTGHYGPGLLWTLMSGLLGLLSLFMGIFFIWAALESLPYTVLIILLVLFAVTSFWGSAFFLHFFWMLWSSSRILLYQYGLRIKRRGTTIALRYEQVEDVVTEPTRLPFILVTLITPQLHRVWAGERVVLTIHPYYPKGYFLARRLRGEVIMAQTATSFARMQAGQEVIFDQLATPTGGAPEPLKLTFALEGLRANDGNIMPWTLAGFTVGLNEQKVRVASLRSLNGNMAFIAEGYPGANIAIALIEKCIEANHS